ncbi:hypothetical protein NLI96_g12912 [Meripilus lineatus]|uniref:Uncharacterized protein n=1 Tax=Meripilus lineatus TaxID=2056292 RepID=A0AAD5UNY0_9APHY|nr:hypothetical protein NLI96_g12912 [Physisporinus lineatus]
MSQSGSPLSLQLGPQRRPRFNLARFRTPYSPGSSPRNINLLTTSGLQTAHPSDQPSPPLVSMLDPTLSPPNPLAEDTQDLTAFINSVADDLAFSGDERQQLHDLALMPMSYQMVSLMASSLWLQAAHEKIATELEDIKKGLQEVAEHLHNDFRLTTSQKTFIKETVRHFFIRPVPDYNSTINDIVQTYMKNNNTKYRLPGYPSDPIVRITADRLINVTKNNMKSNFRRLIWNSIEKRESLKHLTTRVINDNNMGSRMPTAETTKSIASQLALMRKVARPLVGKKIGKGTDTGFWDGMNKSLKRLRDEYGRSRTNEMWRKWEDDLIKADEADFPWSATEHHHDEGLNMDEYDEEMFEGPDFDE